MPRAPLLSDLRPPTQQPQEPAEAPVFSPPQAPCPKCPEVEAPLYPPDPLPRDPCLCARLMAWGWTGVRAPLLLGSASCTLLFPQALIVGYAFHFPHLLSPQIQRSTHRTLYRRHILGIVLRGPALCFMAAIFSLFFVPLVSAGTALQGQGGDQGHHGSDVPPSDRHGGGGQSRRQAGVPPRVSCVRPRAAVSCAKDGGLLLRPQNPACQRQRQTLMEGRGS
ncbi:hypothetical protein P7K49_005795 [Saguinus oedipus]|uniref:Transmembrane protein 79 n=1 Tax=Saguinus oedipus TaxID=9490 RepID=A0ABQ9W0K3_SAGOE|nr:hypothetical protein P7K49_005795 [Saguinus oedipus]